MRYLSVCSGIEAATCAWHHIGWKPEAFSEIEPFPSAVLAHHYPDTPNLGDMTKYKEWNLGAIDLLVGGTPCQSFSVAGLRKGLADPRGNLALVYLGIADLFKPKWIVWENVPGVLSSNGGRDFGSFLGALAELGYGFAYRVLDAQYFGVAQRRRRVFVVGYLGDWRPAAAVLFESSSLSGNPKPSREKGERVAPTVVQGPPFSRTGNQRVECEAIVAQPIHYRKSRRAQTTEDYETWVEDETTNTLNCFDLGDVRTVEAVVQPVGFTRCDHGGDAQRMPDKNNFGAVLQPIPLDSMAFGRDGDKDTRYGLGVGEPGQPSFTLTKAQSHAVAQPIAFHATQDPISGSVAPALGSNMYAGVAQPISIQGNLIGREAGGPQGVGASDEGVMYTLTKADVHGVAQPMCFQQNTRDEVRYISGDGQIAGALAAEAGMKQQNYIQHTMVVRRLTPVECERLQGFLDNYTNIKKNCPDGPRYKALGNSMAVPVMRWIGERINQKDKNT